LELLQNFVNDYLQGTIIYIQYWSFSFDTNNGTHYTICHFTDFMFFDIRCSTTSFV
jgi:hypothetical protein